MIKKVSLILILLLAIFFRLWQINQLPPSLNWDEVSLGYNAYSILHTGRDEWGIKLPLIFRAYGDFKLPLYIYSSIPFIYIFGLNAFSIKLVSILAGFISCIIFYLICLKIFKNSTVLSLVGLTVFSFSPWSIFLSRIALEANLFLCLFLFSFYFLISQKYWQSSFFYGLCLLTYNSSRVLLFPYLLILTFLIIKSHRLKKDWYKYSFFLLVIIIFIFQSLDTSGQARYKWVSLIDVGAINQINELRQTYPRLIVNKYTYFIYTATVNYLKHFDPRYIFLYGGHNYQFSLQNFPLISPFLLPLFFTGLLLLIRQSFKKIDPNTFLVFLFMIISPIPSAITRDAPQILRSITFFPFVILTILYGFSFIKKKLVVVVYTTLFTIFTLINFWQTYPQYSTKFSSSWQYGYPQMVDYLKTNYSQYDQIIVTKRYGEPHEFILFFSQYPPHKYQANKIWDYHSDWYWIDGFDKYKFINDWEVKKLTPNITGSTLLITSPGNYNQPNSRLLKTINFLDGSPAFDFVTYD